jgi:hypothetical protein
MDGYSPAAAREVSNQRAYYEAHKKKSPAEQEFDRAKFKRQMNRLIDDCLGLNPHPLRYEEDGNDIPPENFPPSS